MSTAQIEKRPLSALRPGESGIIDSIETSEAVSIKLMEMGFGKGERVQFIRKAPFGDPIEFEILHYRLALRRAEADKIFLQTETN